MNPPQWRLIALLFSIAALNYADRTSISAVFPLLRSSLGASDLALAGTGTAFLWSYAISSPFAGWFADRVPRGQMVTWSILAWSVMTLLTAFAPNVATLLALRVGLGIAESAYIPAAIGLIADEFPDETRGTAMGIHLSGLSAGMVVGGVLAGFLGDHFGWRSPFLVLGTAGVLLGIAAARFFKGTSRSKTAGPGGAPESALKLIRIPGYLVVVVQAMMIAIGVWIFMNWLPLYFHEKFSMSLAGAGFSGTFALQTASLLGIVAGGFLSDRLAGGRPKRRLLLLAICYFLSAPFYLAFRFRLEAVTLNLAIFGLAFFRNLGAANEGPLVCEFVASRLRSTAIGVMNAANCTVGGAAILLSGFLKSRYGLEGVFDALPLLIILAALIVLIAAWRLKPVQSDAASDPERACAEVKC